MISISKSLNGLVIVVPIVIGAFLSGIFYLAEGSSIPLTLFQITLISGVLLFGFKKIANQDLSFSFYGLELQYLLYLSIIFFSLLYSPERGEGIFFAFRYIILIAMTYLIYNSIETYQELKIVCYTAILIAIIIAAQNVLVIYFNPEVAAFNYINAGTKLIRSSGNEVDPNVFASNYFLPIMLLIAFMGEAKTLKMKVFLFGLVGIIISSVLLTYSRSAWLSIFFGAMIIMLYQRKFSFIGFSLIALFLAVIASESIRTVLFTISERVIDIFAGSSDDSSRFRILLLEPAILMWLDSNMIGVGYQGFPTVFQRYHPPQQTAGVYEPHNEFYAVLAELGLIGFIVFLFIIWKIVSIGWETVKRQESAKIGNTISLSLLASFISYLIFFQFIGGMQFHSILMINIGLLFCASKFVELPSNKEK